MRSRIVVVVVVALTLMLSCESGSADRPLEDTVASRTVSQSARATLAVEVSNIADRDQSVLEVGPDTPKLIVAFPQPPTRTARCIEAARMFLSVQDPPRAPVEMGVYPSILVEAHRLRRGETIGGPATLLDNRPRADALVSDGIVTWNITELYRLWVKGGPFPSQGGAVSRGAPFVVGVRPVEPDPSTVRFAGIEASGERGPRLEVDVIDGCETPRDAEGRATDRPAFA